MEILGFPPQRDAQVLKLQPDEGIQVISATRFVVAGGYSQYFAEYTQVIVDVYQDGRVFLRKEISKRKAINRETLGQSINVFQYPTVAEFRAAHPVVAKQILDYLREEKLRLPWVEDRSPDIMLKVHKCKFCGATKPIKEFPAADGTFDQIHDDCCSCRREYCKREKCFCIAPEQDKCKTCSARK